MSKTLLDGEEKREALIEIDSEVARACGFYTKGRALSAIIKPGGHVVLQSLSSTESPLHLDDNHTND